MSDTWDDRPARPAETTPPPGAPTIPIGRGPAAELTITPEADGRYRAPEGEDPEELGRGGLGRVLAVSDRHLGREIARKELLGHATIGHKARFLQEARVTAQLEHPNIVPVYELGQGPNGVYYTMRRVRGRTLAVCLAEAPDLAARLALLDHFVDLCQAIAYAHSRGVVHRDIKPHNVMVGEFGETVVLDWGLAKVRGLDELSEVAHGIERLGQGATSTVDGTAMGTPAYMSPEQARGDVSAIDERSDVWSLGAVLFEILVGDPPFTGGSALSVLEEVRDGVVPRVRERSREAPAPLAAIVDKALERDPNDRYASAKALADDVIAWRTGGRVGAHSEGIMDHTHRVGRRYQASLLGAAGMLVVALIGGAAWTSHVMDRRDEAVAAQAQAEADREVVRARLAELAAGAAWRALNAGRRERAMSLAAESAEIAPGPETRGLQAAFDGFATASPGVRTLRRDESGPYAVTAEGRLRIDPSGALTAEPVHQEEALVMATLGEAAAVANGDRIDILRGNSLVAGHAVGSATSGLAFSKDAMLLYAVDAKEGWLSVLSSPTGELSRRAQADPAGLITVAVAPDGMIATGGAVLRLWLPDGPRVRRDLDHPEGGVTIAAFSSSGAWLAAGTGEGVVQVWAVHGDDATLHAMLRGHTGPVSGLIFGEENRLLSSASDGVRGWVLAP